MDVGDSASGDFAKKRSKCWTEKEEVALISLVLEKESILFGEQKGCWGRSINQRRSEEWENIASELNKRYVDCKREGPEVKKKYFNLKQRAKQKIDDIKRSRCKTGGGPAPPQLTSAEEALTKSLEGRPGIHGLPNAVDTDDIITDQTNTDEGQKVAETDTKRIKNVADSKLGKRKADQAEMTLQNTILDNERIILEKKKLELEIKNLEQKQLKMESEINLINYQSIYYQLKIQSEFGVSIEDVKNEQ